jgi:hemerythrin-like domain-containing protein
MTQPVQQGGMHPPQSLELTAEPKLGVAATCAFDNLRADHRRMEAYLDRLLAVFEELAVERIPEVRSIIKGIQDLAAVHFEKEEKLLYPRLRSVQPQLLAQMDQQHEVVREVEIHVAAMLADPPPSPDSRWLNELRRLGTEFHDHIQHHIVDEEDHLFRVAEDCLTDEEQRNMGAQMIAVEERLTRIVDPPAPSRRYSAWPARD